MAVTRFSEHGKQSRKHALPNEPTGQGSSTLYGRPRLLWPPVPWRVRPLPHGLWPIDSEWTLRPRLQESDLGRETSSEGMSYEVSSSVWEKMC